MIENKELYKGVFNTLHLPSNNMLCICVFVYLYIKTFSCYLSIPISKITSL